MSTSLFLFRYDLRLKDNPGLFAAARHENVLPVYIYDVESCPDYLLGEASRWWLSQSLQKLNESLGGKLNVYFGKTDEILLNLCNRFNIKHVYASRGEEPWLIELDEKLAEVLGNQEITWKTFQSAILWDPASVLKKDGTPYKVFTPFFKKGCLEAIGPRRPLPLPQQTHYILDSNSDYGTVEKHILPSHSWHHPWKHLWKVGEAAALNQFELFMEKKFSHYAEGRNFPAQDHVSRLSPHLRFGEISPHFIWHHVQDSIANGSPNKERFLAEIGWREFSYYLLFHFPHMMKNNFNSKFDDFPWQANPIYLRQWQKGLTGVPIVDAGMRELWQTGYMHNRVRMIVGSFLVKNLLLSWQEGRKWFDDCLVDADFANNTAGWQWVAGSGADAAPYFRIFNPVSQSENFDSQGEYIRKFVPEIANIPTPYLFAPWTASENILQSAKVKLGVTYPMPIVDLSASRQQALLAFEKIKAPAKI